MRRGGTGIDRWSRRPALTIGVSPAILEVAYNWGDPSWWPFILVDYVAAALLIYGALRSDRVLGVGWGFARAMFYMGFFSIVEEGKTPLALLIGIGAMFAITIVGVVLTVVSESVR